MATEPLSRYDLERKGNPDMDGYALSGYVKGIFETFKSARTPFEDVWMECHYNYLGQYQKATVWKKKTEGVGDRSKVFIKLTTLKCNTAHSKIIDAMFPGKSDVPFDISPYDAKQFGIPQDIAAEAAYRIKKRLQEHFKKIELEETIDSATLECVILGTSVIKGPIVETRRTPQVVKKNIAGIPVDQLDAEISPYELTTRDEVVPVVDHIPLWSYYVDPNAKTTAESIGEIHFQRLLPAQFRKLAYQGGYNREAVFTAAERATLHDESDIRYIQLGDNFMGEQGKKDERVSVLEYWGLVPVKMLREAGCQELPPDVSDDDSIEALVVLAADGIVIKACVNPLGRRPFHVCPYKKRPHAIYGMGVAESMRDSQKMINSSARMIIDNKNLSGNGMVAINLDRINTKRTGDLSIYPGKTWYLKGAFAPKDAIDSVEFRDVTRGLQELMQMFERFADEETGIPKYAHGEQGSFLNKTATGMSMLMTQANINLKTVMKNIDNYQIEPIVEAFNDWFMEMEGGGQIPVKVKATGTDSLVAKEIKMEQYMKFAQVFSSPQDAIFMDRVKLMKIAGRLLETEDIMRSDDEIKKIMDEMSKRGSTPPDLRESVDLDRLYPFLTRNEQVQILKELGIQPDNLAKPVTTPALPPGQNGAPSTPPGAGQVPPYQEGAL